MPSTDTESRCAVLSTVTTTPACAHARPPSKQARMAMVETSRGIDGFPQLPRPDCQRFSPSVQARERLRRCTILAQPRSPLAKAVLMSQSAQPGLPAAQRRGILTARRNKLPRLRGAHMRDDFDVDLG